MSDTILVALLFLAGTAFSTIVPILLGQRAQSHQIASTDAGTQNTYVGIIATLQKTISDMLSLQSSQVSEISGLHRQLDEAMKTIADSNKRADRFEKLADERAAEINKLTARVSELSKLLGLKDPVIALVPQV